MAKPKPVPTGVVCSKCGLKWDDHGENPTLETCIVLLRRELMRRPALRSALPYQGSVSGQPLNAASSQTVPATVTHGWFDPFALPEQVEE